jgi:toxin-antitoxin system PIN domain toxin
VIGIDTNLLVYAHRAGSENHAAARKAIEKAAEHPQGWGVPLTCLCEFWAVVTHPSCVGGPSTPQDAEAYLGSLAEQGGAQIWLPGPDFGARLVRLFVDLKITGYRTFDLQIALTAADNGAAELWTHDRGFVTVPGLKIRDPLASSS